MRPEFVYVRCPHCARVYRTPAGVCLEKLPAMLPILKMVTATCPFCETPAKIGNLTIESPQLRT